MLPAAHNRIRSCQLLQGLRAGCSVSAAVVAGVVPLALLAMPTAVLAQQTLYRYMAYETPFAPSHVSNPVVQETVNAPLHVILRSGDFGWFKDFQYGAFRGDERYAFAPAPGVAALAGDFTVTAYLRRPAVADSSAAADGMIIADSHPAIGGGFQLMLTAEGRLVGRIALRPADETLTAIGVRELAAPGLLEEDRWYRVVYRYQRDADRDLQYHDLWIDEHPVAMEALSLRVTRAPSSLSPVVGALRGSGIAWLHSLHADVHAVQVDDYAQHEFYLQTPVLRDGSTYFGGMDYHDYLGLESADGKIGGQPLERRITGTYWNAVADAPHYPGLDERLTGRWIVPLQNDGYVVQGLAVDPTRQRLFIAMYHLTVSGTSYTHPSLIAEVYPDEGRLGNVFILHDETGQPLGSHVGGIAYWDGYLFVPDRGAGSAMNPDLFVYSIDGLADAAFDPQTLRDFQPVPITAMHRYRDPLGNLVGPDGRFNSLSFMGIHRDVERRIILHIGNFQSDRARITHLFEVDFTVAGPPALSYRNTIAQSHRRAQGSAFYFDASVNNRRIQRKLLATSFGNNDSVIYNSLYLDGGSPISSSEILRMPAGLEEIALHGNSLWAQSESGALHYQKRPSNPWTDTFPFLIRADIRSLIDSNANGIADSWYARHGLSPSQNPHVDVDGDGFTVYQEYLADTDPRDPLDFPYYRLEQHPLRWILPSSDERFYRLESSVDLIQWSAVPAYERLRGSNGPLAIPLHVSGSGRFFRLVTATD